MRTNIDIDDQLMADTIKATGAKTKREAVETAMRLYLQQRSVQDGFRALRGQVNWEGDLDQMRRDA